MKINFDPYIGYFAPALKTCRFCCVLLVIWLSLLGYSAIGYSNTNTTFIENNQSTNLALPKSIKLPTKGSSTTLLANGQWLLLGGMANNGEVSANAWLYQPKTQKLDLLKTRLNTARSSHTATLLPDGKVLVLGGIGNAGKTLADAGAELFNPITGKSSNMAIKLVPRSQHRATLLVDGTVLVSGGLNASGVTLKEVVKINPITGKSQVLDAKLANARYRHQSTLLPAHEVLIWGGLDKNKQAIENGELYQPGKSQLQQHGKTGITQLLDSLNNQGLPTVVDSQPVHGAVNVKVGQWLSVSFSKPLDMGSLNANTVLLFGPDGQTPVHVTPAENGLVVFVKPKQELLPGADYTLMVKGAEDKQDQALPWTNLAFKTQSFNAAPDNTATNAPGTVDNTNGNPANPLSVNNIPPTVSSMIDSLVGVNRNPGTTNNGVTSFTINHDFVLDDESWVPGEQHRHGHWRNGKQFAHSRDTQRLEREFKAQLDGMTAKARKALLDRMQATGELQQQLTFTPLPGVSASSSVKLAAGENAITGQVLRLNGKPLKNVTLKMAGQQTVSDANGEFVLKGIPVGGQVLTIDGETANQGTKRYGRFDYRANVQPGLNALDFTIWMSRLDTRYAVPIPSPTTQEVVVTHPDIPGFEMRIPAGAVIRDADGKIVTEITLTPLPVDQTPFPIPGFNVPAYFTVQPGGAHIEVSQPNLANGGRIIYPNYSHELAGANATFWNYDPHSKGWFSYGLGKVAQNGKQVLPDPGVVVHNFTGAMFDFGSAPPSPGPKPCPLQSCCQSQDQDADPVSCYEGLFLESNIDLSADDVTPLNLTRTYRTKDANRRPFGIGSNHNYFTYLYNTFAKRIK